MPTAQDTIIARLRTTVPPDVLARDEQEVLISWISDAAAEINARRSRLTVHEATIALAAAVSNYTLPSGCIRVDDVIRVGVNTPEMRPLGVPVVSPLGMGLRLPTGQMINHSVDFIRRQGQRSRDRETRWHVLAGELWIDFPAVDGESIRVVYFTEARDPETLPERYWNPVVDFLRARVIEHQIHVMLGIADTAADGMRRSGVAALQTLLARLDARWNRFVSGISPSETD